MSLLLRDKHGLKIDNVFIISLWYMPKSGIAGSYVVNIFYLIFGGTAKMTMLFAFLLVMCMGASFFTHVFDCSHINVYKVVPHSYGFLNGERC